MTKETNDKDKNKEHAVINLAEKIQQISANTKDPEMDIEEALEKALDTFESTLDDAKGFITITFDQNDAPSIVHAGDLDLLKTLGTLEFIKNEFLFSPYLQDHSDEVTE